LILYCQKEFEKVLVGFCLDAVKEDGVAGEAGVAAASGEVSSFERGGREEDDVLSFELLLLLLLVSPLPLLSLPPLTFISLR
jgi:hypothetical protein